MENPWYWFFDALFHGIIRKKIGVILDPQLLLKSNIIVLILPQLTLDNAGAVW